MSLVVAYALDDETTAYFEIEPVPGFQPASADQLVGKLQEAVTPAIEGARAVLERVRALQPDEVEVTFGVKATGTMNWVVAKAATEANFAVKLTWKPSSGSQG